MLDLLDRLRWSPVRVTAAYAGLVAVATEAFFERPTKLRARHPDLYAELAACDQQDPAVRG